MVDQKEHLDHYSVLEKCKTLEDFLHFQKGIKSLTSRHDMMSNFQKQALTLLNQSDSSKEQILAEIEKIKKAKNEFLMLRATISDASKL